MARFSFRMPFSSCVPMEFELQDGPTWVWYLKSNVPKQPKMKPIVYSESGALNSIGGTEP